MKLAAPSDRPVLTALWTACFGDPPAAVESFWNLMWQDITVFLSDDGDAMATAMPVRWQDRPAAYLYAVATRPDRQGQGLCRRLMTEAEDCLIGQGVSYAILSPAEEPLFRFYEKLGYETCFFCHRIEFSAGSASLPVSPVSPAEYAGLRQRFGPEGVEYPESLLRLQASLGSLLKVGDLGCAAVEQYGEQVFVRELLSADPEAAASSLCHFLNVPRITAKMPGTQPYGMAKSLDGSPLTASYLGLAFE